MFNPYDSTDFIPNYKVISFSKVFTGRSGIFLIGDSVVYAPTRTEEDVFGSPITTYGDTEATDWDSENHAESKYQIPDGDYVKVRAKPAKLSFRYEGGYEYIEVGMELISQKKKSMFWRAHNSDIHLVYDLKTPLGDGFWATDRIEHVYDKLTDEQFRLGFAMLNKIGAGTVNYLTGPLEIWSNEIPKENRGKSTVRLPD